MDLLEQVKELQERRLAVEAVDDVVKLAKAAWEIDNKELLASQEQQKVQLNELEMKVRTAAVQGYELDGAKERCPGVSIKIFEELRYDPKKALAWAIAHSMALKLEARGFEKVAKVQDIDFVEKREVAKAMVAQDLGKVLETVETEAATGG